MATDVLLPCKVCIQEGVKYPYKIDPNNSAQLYGHLKGHKGWDKKRYQAEFGAKIPAPIYKDEEEVKRVRENAIKNSHFSKRKRVREGLSQVLEGLNKPVREMLVGTERDFFDQYVEDLYQKTDRDESQMPVIMSIAFDMIQVTRLRSTQLSFSGRTDTKDFADLDGLEKALKEAEGRIARGMKALGIDRESQLKRGQSIKSTPACMIAGYLSEVENMTPEVLEALMLEEKRVYANMMSRIEKYILSKVTEKREEEAKDVVSDRPLSLEEAFERAGVVVGGSEKPSQQIGSGEGEFLPI